MLKEDFEIMAPVGSWESLAAALRAGAGSVYFGVESLNMRAGSASRFTLTDLPDIVRKCRMAGVRAYLTVNTIIYDTELELMRRICLTARDAGITAVIASDVAVLTYCRQIGVEVHLSTQLNISNLEALRFYARYADVAVLARELNLGQVRQISEGISREHICGPGGRPVRIEMFCHGALCMAVSGKCYLSLDNQNSSANRGACLQVCRRSYEVRDRDSGLELEVDNKYIMSPKDLCTIGFIDLMMKAGVRVFKIEGRARGADYVQTTVRCYREAIDAVIDGTYTPERVAEWTRRLQSVFNRGFWDGYYLGRRMGEWSARYGSSATERKEYVGKGMKYFSRLGVMEIVVEAGGISRGDRLLFTGPTTGALSVQADELRVDDSPVERAGKGAHVSLRVPRKARPNDKVFRIVSVKPDYDEL